MFLECSMEIANGFDNSSILHAVDILTSGGIIAFPTETVYGLGADGLNAYAVAKIFEAKNRPHFDPLILHVGQSDWVDRYAETVPTEALKLIKAFWPGPLTLILRKKHIVPDIVTAGLPTVAMRMPAHPVALALIQKFGRALAAPSANPFGYVSPTKADHVSKMLDGKIPLVLDGGDSVFGIESTIVSVTDRGVRIHRHGAISEEELKQRVHITDVDSSDPDYRSPGELPYHYSPHKPLRIINRIDEIEIENSAFLAFKQPATNPKSRYLRVLSKRGDLKEAAANLFSYLIELDNADTGIIYAEEVPAKGIGRAIMERLLKAANRSR